MNCNIQSLSQELPHASTYLDDTPGISPFYVWSKGLMCPIVDVHKDRGFEFHQHSLRIHQLSHNPALTTTYRLPN